MRFRIIIFLLFSAQALYGQRSLNHLLNNKEFNWLTDSSSTQLIIYYQADTWTSSNLEGVRYNILNQIEAVKLFIGIKSYNATLHQFVVESRIVMKDLIGRQTNGTAFYKHNVLAGIGSDNVRSIYSTHEIFHVLAMNVWGVPEVWINEGMAVYSSKQWHGYDLYQLTKYLIDNDRYVALERLINKFRQVDDLESYPLIGSFARYLEETYGRETVIKIWQGKIRDIKVSTGKSINELEQDWLNKIRTVEYSGIDY